jgi:hypothetical protein
MLDTVDKAVSSSDGQIQDKPNLPERRSLASTPELPAENSYLGQEWFWLCQQPDNDCKNKRVRFCGFVNLPFRGMKHDV